MKRKVYVFLLILSIIFTTMFNVSKVNADSKSQALPASIGKKYDNSCSRGNPKYYKITLDKAGLLTFNVGSYAGKLDVDIYKSNSDSACMSFITRYDSDFGHYVITNKKFCLQAGTYFVKFSNYNYDTNDFYFRYTVKFSSETFPEVDRNDCTFSTANTLQLGKVTYGMTCYEAANDEADMFKFTLRYQQIFNLELRMYDGFDNSDIELYIYGPDKEVIYSPNRVSFRYNKTIKTRMTLGKGTYYIKIKGDNYEKYKLKVWTSSVISNDYTGVMKTTMNQKAGYYYVRGGMVRPSTTGIYKHNKKWYYVKNGQMTFKENGLVQGTINGRNTLWHVKNSKVVFDTTLVKYNGEMYGVFKGYYDPKRSGIVDYNGYKWYVKNGKLASSYSGTITISGVKYKISKGKVVN